MEKKGSSWRVGLPLVSVYSYCWEEALVLHRHASASWPLSVSKQMLELLSHIRPYGLCQGSSSLRRYYLSVCEQPSITVDATSPSSPLVSSGISPPPHARSLSLSLSVLHSGSCVRSPGPLSFHPPHWCFLQRTHWSPADTDRHLRESHWCLCVSVSVQQQGSRCEIRLHAGPNWTQGSPTCIVASHILIYW